MAETLGEPIAFIPRNKCEFTIGYMSVEKKKASEELMELNSEGDKATIEEVKADQLDINELDKVEDIERKVSVGFRLASYKAGNVEVCRFIDTKIYPF